MADLKNKISRAAGEFAEKVRAEKGKKGDGGQKAERVRGIRNILIAVIMLTVAVLVIVHFFKPVKSISLLSSSGSSPASSYYTDESILEQAGLETAPRLFFARSDRIRDSILSVYGEKISSLDVRVNYLKSSISIVIHEDGPKYGVYTPVAAAELYTILDGAFNVVKVQATYIPEGCALISGVKLIDPEEGSPAEFDYDHVVRDVEMIREHFKMSVPSSITEYDVGPASKLAFVFNGRMKIVLGDSSDIDNKMKSAATVIKTMLERGREEPMAIDVTAVKQVYVRVMEGGFFVPGIGDNTFTPEPSVPEEPETAEFFDVDE